MIAQPQYRETVEYRHEGYEPLHPSLYTLNPQKHLQTSFLECVEESKQLTPLLEQYLHLQYTVYTIEEEAEKNEREEYTDEEENVRQQFVQVQKEFNTARRDVLAKWLTLEAPEVYSCNVFSLDFCQQMIEEVEHFRNSVEEVHLRPNSMNRFGVVCDEMGMSQFFDDFVCNYFTHVARLMNRGGFVIDDHHTFVVEYQPNGDVSLDKHVDDSEITINLCMGKPGFEGGNVFFAGLSSKPKTHNQYFEYENVIGQCALHDGEHMHGACPLTKGTRLNLIIWCRSSMKRKDKKSRINFHATYGPYARKEEQPTESSCDACNNAECNNH